MEEKTAGGKGIPEIIKYNRWVNRRISHYTGAGITILFALIYWLVS